VRACDPPRAIPPARPRREDATGDTAPDISATIGTSAHEPFEPSAHLGDEPALEPDYEAIVEAVEDA
jgi:hypothetical protein